MKLGMFSMPSHPPERRLKEAIEWDLQTIRWADEYGYSEFWIGEHFTAPWEPVPAPDLLIAQAIDQTSQIKLAAGAHLLPYHHPAELAHRVAQLDHMLQGRLMLGIGASGFPSDWEMFGVDGFAGENRRMTAEALDVILQIWAAEERFEHHGEFYDVVYNPELQFDTLRAWLKPFQDPHPAIGVTGLSSPSPTLEMAGERGFMPMSISLNTTVMASHWDSVVKGAARAGRVADRNDWHCVREVLVCETDAEAQRWAVNSHMGRMNEEYLLPLMSKFGVMDYFKHDPSVPDGDVTPEYMAKHAWLVGSPETVAEKLAEQFEAFGGFGTLLMTGFDYSEDPEVWRESMERMAKEVMPKVADLLPQAASEAELAAAAAVAEDPEAANDWIKREAWQSTGREANIQKH